MENKIVSKICRICGSDQLIGKFTVRNIVVDKCNNCGFVQVRVKPSREELEEIYGDHYFKHNKYTDSLPIQKEYERRLKLMQSAGIPEGSKILDAGCAVGDFITFLGERYEVWGNDISEFAIEEARKNNPNIADRLSAGLLEDQNYTKESFDAIILWDVIEHLWDPMKVSSELLEYLKPGGFIFISTPNIGAPTAKIMGKFWAFFTPPEHLCFFDRKTITYLFEKNLKCTIYKWFSRGKWVNFGFLLYKIKRILPRIMPRFIIKIFQKGILGKICLYIPTGDVQYIAVEK